jgi:carbon-monoxide dehydrogenase medium subunit
MKPAQFDYQAPERLDELLELLADEFTDVRVIAGGQSLVPMMNFRLAAPERLLDLRRIDELERLDLSGGELVVGARVTQARLLRELERDGRWPVLAEGIRHIGHPQIRSRGTVCGSLAHHDPTAELPALAVVLGARMTARSSAGARQIPAEQFFTSYYENALEPGELLSEVVFPAWPARRGWAFQEIARRRGDFALVGAVATVDRDAAGSAVATARLVVFGAAERPLLLDGVDALLRGTAPDAERVEAVRRLVAETVAPVDDAHAGADYRRANAARLAGAAIERAWERSGGV